MKKVFFLAGVLALTTVLPVLVSPQSGGGAGRQVLKVGATPVPHAELLNLIKSDLAAQGIDLRVVEFTDYVTPNLSLAAGDLDANFFQHTPYLELFAAERNLNLVSAFGVHIEPLGLYSRSLKNIGELRRGASIAIPNDPTNRGRALLLLQANGLITLSASAGIEGTPADIISNPRNLRFRELEAAQLPRALGDVDAAVINGNYALDAGLNPVNDSLILEGAQSPYVNIVAVKAGNENDPRIRALAAALCSQKVKNYILAAYNGGVVPAF
ncbi:MAG: MetQ/NlpA family ABC transporter substrate-binding protein [Spirochaetaceae bacterium]|jgi:D-methionine transport system substrate-binding protein|nr:MetQ/NlpA family ABC transporter substrate-binding protein [Spirochaetaceae bacterium]